LINVPNLSENVAPSEFQSFTSKGSKVADSSDQRALEEQIWNLEQNMMPIPEPTQSNTAEDSYNFSEYLITPQQTENETYNFAEPDLSQQSTENEVLEMSKPIPEAQAEETQAEIVETKAEEPQAEIVETKAEEPKQEMVIAQKEETLIPKEIAPEPKTEKPAQIESGIVVPKSPVVKDLAEELKVFQKVDKQEISKNVIQTTQAKTMSTSSKVGISLGIATLIGGSYWYLNKHKK
jgi:hypothetical protein